MTATAAAPSPTPSAPATAGNNTATKASSAAPAAVPGKKIFTVAEGSDALSFGSDFVRALLRHDFTEARKYVDEKKVPTERLAGLCIVFEEGRYEFKPTKPLIITVANPEVSWVIAQVQSPSLQQSTEFGLELQRSGLDQPWRVVGLNLSEILGSYAASASKLGVPYTPIVKNPSGGESLALYFEYDQAQLHPRAQKQLEIVAGLLKSDPGKKLHITGHTDAKGTDDYNLRLSLSRADTVKKQLSALGVSESQIITTAAGKAQPLSPNQKADGSDDPEGRSKNRRAEIFLDF
jgi:outer membrane protein OmpA-like peptidoglycan-associated protein